MATVSSALAPDAAVPLRDALLDSSVFADAVARSLAVEITACRRVRARYHVARSLRVLYELELGPRRLLLAARTFRRPPADVSAEVTDAVPPVFRLDELGAVVWVYPNDRKVRGVATLGATIRELLARELRVELVAWAPEKSVSVACRDATGVVAYAKAYAVDGTAVREGRFHEDLRAQLAAVPRALAATGNVLAVEPAAGGPLAATEDADAYARYAVALAHLHSLTPPDGAERFERLEPERIVAAARLIGAARPDVDDAASALARKLLERRPRTSGGACLHGDAHPKNALDDGARVTLIDLEQVAAGDPAAELGSLLASLRYRVVTGELRDETADTLERAILAAYGDYGPRPPSAVIAWSTAAALLAERAQRAVTRVRESGLTQLPALLQHAHAVLDGAAP